MRTTETATVTRMLPAIRRTGQRRTDVRDHAVPIAARLPAMNFGRRLTDSTQTHYAYLWLSVTRPHTNACETAIVVVFGVSQTRTRVVQATNRASSWSLRRGSRKGRSSWRSFPSRAASGAAFRSHSDASSRTRRPYAPPLAD